MTPVASRWLKFNFVGALGAAVQFAMLAMLTSVFQADSVLASGLAVETAVLHNFAWHEGFTWKHLPRGTSGDVALRLARFHLGNGLISIAGNMALMAWLARSLHMNQYAATTVAIGVCAIANFAVSERFVFRR